MRKLLANPFMVFLIVLVAVSIVYQNILSPLKQVRMLDTAKASTFHIAGKREASLKEISLPWRLKRNDRNPFSQPLHKTKLVHQQGLTLSAILSDKQNALALINGKLAHVGDHFGRFTIRAIHPNSVLLSDAKNIKTLYLNKHSRSNP